MPFVRKVGTMGAIPVELSRQHAAEIAVPHIAVAFGQVYPGFRALVIEQTQGHARGVTGKDSEIDPTAVEMSPQRERPPL